MPEQYCIGSITSKSVAIALTEVGSITITVVPNIQASEMVLICPVESRQTHVFSRYFGPSSYKA